MKYNLFNPSRARRIIHDGLESARRIEILPNEIVRGVSLADHVVVHLRQLEKSNPTGELAVTEAGEASDVIVPRQMQIDDSLVSVIKATPPASEPIQKKQARA